MDGGSPIGFMSCSRVACRISLKANKMAQCSLQPQQPLVFGTFKICMGLSRVAFSMRFSEETGHVSQQSGPLACGEASEVLLKPGQES